MTTRICPHCQGHFDVGNWICPHCGAEFKRPRPARPGWVQRLAPSYGSLTKGIILVTGLVFLLQMILERNAGPTGLSIRMGALFAPLVNEGQLWRLVTPMLLHGGLMHILFNMFALFQLGPLVEQAFGRTRFLVIYVGAGIAGSLGSYLFGSGAPSVGASGAICGFLGVMAVWGFRRGGALGEIVRRQMITWAVIILVWGLLMPRIDNAAHAGGFVGGVALGYLVSPRGFRQETFRRQLVWNVASALTLAVVAVCVVASGIYCYEATIVRRHLPRIDRLSVALAHSQDSLLRTYTLIEGADAPRRAADLRSAASVMALDAASIRKDDPGLGGGSASAAAEMVEALTLRARQLIARAEKRTPPTGDPRVAARVALHHWQKWLRWYALR